jgi:hypothetical protein
MINNFQNVVIKVLSMQFNYDELLKVLLNSYLNSFTGAAVT